MYYLKIIGLENCPYSIEAYNLLKINNIQHKIKWVNTSEKELHKNNDINTFPQIYLKKKNNNGNLLLGGYTDLKYSIDFLKNKNEYDKDNFKKKYNKWSFKAIEKLNKLINNI